MTAVVFVLDYVQLQLEDIVITYMCFPSASTKGKEYRFGDSDYRNVLCDFIGQTILEVEFSEASFGLGFEQGVIEVSLASENYRSPERVVITSNQRTIAF